MAESTFLRIFSLLFFIGGGLCIDDVCVKCLCEFINEGPSCSYLVGCHDGVCGPYGITMPFWVDAGRPRYGDGDAKKKYQECSNDLTCAETTIRNYMDKYKKDCNDDGKVDCYDYAGVHANGPEGCKKKSLNKEARDALTDCLERSNSIPEPEEEDPKGDAETIAV